MDQYQDPWIQESTKKEAQEKVSITGVLAFIFSILIPPAGLILAIISLRSIKSNPNIKGYKLALAGIITSIVIIILIVIYIALVYLFGISLLL